jgi:hypothetical protein
VLDPLDLSMTTAPDLAGLASADLAGGPDIAQLPEWQTMSSGTTVDLYGVWGRPVTNSTSSVDAPASPPEILE